MKTTLIFVACLAYSSIASAECKIVTNGKQVACNQQQEKSLAEQLSKGLASIDAQMPDTSNVSRLQSPNNPVLGTSISDTTVFHESARDLQERMKAMSEAIHGADLRH